MAIDDPGSPRRGRRPDPVRGAGYVLALGLTIVATGVVVAWLMVQVMT